MIVTKVLIVLVALFHAYFWVLEMFLWRTRARKIFQMSEEKAEATAQLAGNQGLYNAFLAAGLVWALATSLDRAPFFLGCVAIAGLYGAYSVNRRILFVQTLPATAALITYYLSL